VHSETVQTASVILSEAKDPNAGWLPLEVVRLVAVIALLPGQTVQLVHEAAKRSDGRR
jgi:hypothetical protein